MEGFLVWFYKITNTKNKNQLCITYNSLITYFKNIVGLIGILACIYNVIWLAIICLFLLGITLSIYLYKYGSLIS